MNLECIGEEALLLNSRLHDQRLYTKGYSSPETGGMHPFFIIFRFIESFLI